MNEIFEKLQMHEYPFKSGLDYRNRFTFLIGILLSAQSRDDFINTQTPALFDKADDAAKMHALGIDGIAWHIQRIGLWRNKAKHIYFLCEKIMHLRACSIDQLQLWRDCLIEKQKQNQIDDLHVFGDGLICLEGIPTFRAGLEDLPGIGRKSANVFLNIVYGAAVFPVDTHVLRVVNRWSETGDVNAVEQKLIENVPFEFAQKASAWIVWHGRKICTARKPKCNECHLKELCNYFKSNN